MTGADDDDLVSVADVAQLYGCHQSTVHRRLKDQLAAATGRPKRVRRADAAAAMPGARRTYRSAPPKTGQGGEDQPVTSELPRQTQDTRMPALSSTDTNADAAMRQSREYWFRKANTYRRALRELQSSLTHARADAASSTRALTQLLDGDEIDAHDDPLFEHPPDVGAS